MWQPKPGFLKKIHVACSVAALISALTVASICVLPASAPGVYRFLVDDRIGIVIPYVLFIVLGESIFSIWYFVSRK